MEEEDQLHLILPGSSFCRQNLQTGGVCVCVYVCFVCQDLFVFQQNCIIISLKIFGKFCHLTRD